MSGPLMRGGAARPIPNILPSGEDRSNVCALLHEEAPQHCALRLGARAGACNLSVAETQPALNIKDAWLVARCAGARLRDYRDDRVDHNLRPYPVSYTHLTLPTKA